MTSPALPALNPWRRIAALLPIFVAGAAAWFFPALMDRFGRGMGYVALLLSVPVFLALLTGLSVATSPPRVEPGETSRLRRWIIFAAAALLFCVSAGRDLDRFPRLLTGESADATLNAQLLLSETERGAFWERAPLQALSYNTGLVPVMTPLVKWFGPGPIVSKWVNIVVAAVLIGCVLALTAGRAGLVIPRSIWLLVWLTPVCYGALLASVRQYRWHLLAVLASIGFMVASRAFEREQRLRSLAEGLLLFLLGLSLYHGCIIYAPAFSLLAIWHLLQPEDGKRRWLAAILFFLIGPVLVGLVALVSSKSGLALRAGVELGAIGDYFNRDLQIEMSRQLLEVPRDLLTWSGATVALVGFASLLRRVPRCAYARATILLLAGGFAASLLARGFGNPSQNCWFLAPALVCVVMGLAEITGRIFAAVPSVPVATVLGAAACSLVACQEWDSYRELGMYFRLDSSPRSWNTTEQLALVVREVARSQQVESIPTRQFIPGEEFVVKDGGFSNHIPPSHFEEPGMRPLIEFSSLAELEALLASEEATGKPGVDIIWVSAQPDYVRPEPSPLENWLVAHGFRTRLLTLESAPASEAIKVWKFSRRRQAGRGGI